MNTYFDFREPQNEPIVDYNKNSEERTELSRKLREIGTKTEEIPIIINGKELKTGDADEIRCPHDFEKIIAKYYKAKKHDIENAINSAIAAKQQWQNTPWQERATVLLKAAELISKKYRYQLNASTMLEQSKTVHQAEIDAACKTIDFLRFNVFYASCIYKQQPNLQEADINYVQYRPLEGFVYTTTPYNSTSTALNSYIAPILMGNTAVWHPAKESLLSSFLLMKILKEAGLPDGVLNFVPGDIHKINNAIISNKNLGAINYSGEKTDFVNLWKQLAQNIEKYTSFPVITSECRGKSFIFAHSSANISELSTGLIRGAFEFQGQKNASTSKAYIPMSIWNQLQEKLENDISKIKTGNIETFTNFVGAVINEESFNKIATTLEHAKKTDCCKIIIGGNINNQKGYFVAPTVIRTTDPYCELMHQDIQGPILTIYVYNDTDFEQTLEICNNTSKHSASGALFANERYAITMATEKLLFASGNFFINDKPSENVVNKQPVQNTRLTGTNNQKGGAYGLLNWLSPRSINENLMPPQDYKYPFMEYIEYYL